MNSQMFAGILMYNHAIESCMYTMLVSKSKRSTAETVKYSIFAVDEEC